MKHSSLASARVLSTIFGGISAAHVAVAFESKGPKTLNQGRF